jgi:hypothetical protein
MVSMFNRFTIADNRERGSGDQPQQGTGFKSMFHNHILGRDITLLSCSVP